MPCLDVLIDLPVQGGQEKYGGKNMDAIQKLLDFMEKRIDKVRPRAGRAQQPSLLLSICRFSDARLAPPRAPTTKRV